jgi:hypothetical protein
MVDIIVNKNGSQSLKSDNRYIMIKESDFIKMRKAGLELDEMVENHIHRDDYKKFSNRLFSVINKHDYKPEREMVLITKRQWDKLKDFAWKLDKEVETLYWDKTETDPNILAIEKHSNKVWEQINTIEKR